MLEDYLIACCSPTLASLKTANLFNYPFSSESELQEQLQRWNDLLGQKGVSLTVLRQNEHSALVYVYRKAGLLRDWRQSGVKRFLAAYGYQRADVDSAIDRLRDRLAQSDGFPHEIGLFLGYPLDDVKGFICNGGKNCKCVGCWKVYGDECRAKQTFAKFKKCSSVYAGLWNSGSRSVWQLTVAGRKVD